MTCPNCNKTIPDDSIFCPECGVKISEYGLAPGMMRCPACGAPTPKKSNFCTNCRAPLSPQATQAQREAAMQAAQLKMQAENLRLQQEQLRLQQEQISSMLRCPRCGSTAISGQKKGYGAVKGGLGALAIGAVAGPVGAVVGLGAGNIGRKKVICTCMNCGYRFKAGRK